MDNMEQLRVLGVESEEKLALGIDPDEVLEFLGTWVYVIQQLTLANFLFHGYRNEDRSRMTWLKHDRYWRTLVASNLGTSIILALLFVLNTDSTFSPPILSTLDTCVLNMILLNPTPGIIQKYEYVKNSREDLISKFQSDIPKLSADRTLAESEVDKFLLDGEMLDLYIKYSQRKREDPTWEPQYAPEDNSPIGKIASFASQYAIWIVGGLVLKDVITNFMSKSDGGGSVIGG